MAGQNDFLVFDENSENILTQALYASDEDRTEGFKTGLARSNVNNKVLRQTSIMASALGELVKNQGGQATDSSQSDLKSNLNRLFPIKKYYIDAIYDLDDMVIGELNGLTNLYKSLVANNTGNPLSDNTKWEKVEMSGGGRNIGEIVASTVPLTDAGLHLLDGALLQYGIYQAFIDYIADLYDSGDYTSLFATESDWQSSVSQYGVCGKFVYDSVSNTVRLPKITGIVEGIINPTLLGNLVEAGLPNITGTLVEFGHGTGSASTSGAFRTTYTSQAGSASGSGLSYHDTTFDASRSSSIYGNSSTVQPQTIKVLYYIIVATSTKTDIEVDIDEIATDLNNKVDKSGDTMTGALNVQTDGSRAISIINTGIEQGVIPSAHKYEYYNFRDVNDVTLGGLYYRFGSDGNISIRLSCNDLNNTGNVALF